MDAAEKVWFRNARHVEDIESTSSLEIENKDEWRKIRERMKTVSVALVFCLNIGVDPPNVDRPNPCARKEAWVEPNMSNPQKSAQKIALSLQKVYEKLQPRARYKSAIDPTVEVVKKLCTSLRKNAKEERVLFHFNGHGVPKPTNAGEIWVFNKNITQDQKRFCTGSQQASIKNLNSASLNTPYIPLSLYDLQCWMGAPSVYLWDCCSAGTIVNMFLKVADDHAPRCMEGSRMGENYNSTNVEENIRKDSHFNGSSLPYLKESIQLGACRADENLPTNPDLPADLFTSCLTSPIQTSLLCHMLKTGTKNRFPPNIIDEIPGVVNDRRTLLGELNWIFAAITDTIAWSSLPMDTFQKLFRQDLLIASLFRSFLLAERIMYEHGCHVVSQPQLSSVRLHPFWEYWDHTLDLCLSNMYNLIAEKGNYVHLRHNDWFVSTSMKHNLMVDISLLNNVESEYSFSSFFIEQLQAFEVWLMFGIDKKSPPQQLPVLLQVLLSQAHRVRALELLARFVDLGSWAVVAALSVGIFPYVLKLLQCGTRELQPALAFIWAKILSIDPVCQQELIRDNGFMYFLNILNDSGLEPRLKIVPAFVLSMLIYNNYRPAQKKLIEGDYVSVCVTLLSDKKVVECRMLCLWLLIGLGRLWVEYDEARWLATRNVIYERVEEFLEDDAPEVRAAAAYALGCFVHNRSHNNEHATIIDNEICRILCDKCAYDGSVLVRAELVVAIQWFLIDFESYFLDFHTKLDVELELAATKRKKAAANGLTTKLTNLSTIKRSSSSIAQPKKSEKSTVLRKRSLMSAARDVSVLLTPQEALKLRLYEEMKFLEAKTFKTSFERIWLALLRLCFDAYEQVSSMCMKLVNHILEISLKRKSERVASVMVDRIRSSNSEQSRDVENANNVRFMIGSPAGSALTNQSYLSQNSEALSAVENINQQLRECTSVADMVSNGLIETASTNFAPKRNIFGSQSGRYSSSSANPDENILAEQSLKNEIVSTKFVEWCSKLFTQPIYKTIYDDTTCIPTNNLLVSQEKPFTTTNSTDWALHTNEGLKQKLLKETLLLKNEKAKFDSVCATFYCDFPISNITWSFLRPYIYMCDGLSVSLYNFRESTKCSEFLAYSETLVEDNISEMLTINELTHELLITGTDNGLIEVWDPMFSEHSHNIQEKPKLITAAYLLGDQPRVSTHKSTNNYTLYQWDQDFGRIACSGNVRVCRLWDAWAEKGVLDLSTKNKNHCTSSVAMDLGCNLVSCGFDDGTMRVYDVRLPPEQNTLMELHHFSATIVGSKILSNGQLIAGSSYGDVRIWEMRMFHEPIVEFQSIDKGEVGMTTMQFMDVQCTAEIISCTQKNSIVHLFDMSGKRLAQAVARSNASQDLAAVRFHQGQILLALAGKNSLTVFGLPQ